MASARWGWGHDALAPQAVLVAPDDVVSADRFTWMHAHLVTLRGEPATAALPVVIDDPTGQRLSDASADRVFSQWVAGRDRGDEVHVQFRLSPESGFGPLRAVATLAIANPGQQFVAFDLEAIGSAGRYDLGPANRDRLLGLLDQRRVVYLADVDLAGYNRLRAELRSGAWPVGPLVMWRRTTEGDECSARKTASRLRDRLAEKLVLAVVSELKDNREAFGRSITVVTWSQTGAP